METKALQQAKAEAGGAIEAKKELLFELSDRIWSYAELSLQEVRSAALFEEICEREGFLLEKGVCGIETAFTASYGSGSPRIGILAEYDALSGLSQKAGEVTRQEVIPGGSGHGCGHNLLGAGALAAALGVKAFLESHQLPGTVILYGCPGEEGGASKAFMARDGIWSGLDAALTWHPDDCNEVVTGSTNSCIQVQYSFTGRASHAAQAPELGRSALDAVELMNIGVQFLREHMSEKARIHYAITNSGGISPNVVPERASVLYMVRENHVRDCIALQKRVDKIAEGAALMTETVLSRRFIDGLSDTVTNHTIEQALYDNFASLGVPSYSREELDFARAIESTYEKGGVPGFGSMADPLIREEVAKMQRAFGEAMNGFLLPCFTGETFKPGSTDVGDVSWLCPVGQIHVAARPNGCPAHSWQNVSCGGVSLGKKSILTAGKVLAMTAIDLFCDPELLSKAREEFLLRTREGYCCPIPGDAIPCVPDL